MAEPVLVGLLFADRVIEEKNNKKGIIGTFNRFFSPNFPVVFPPWYIYAAVTNLSGEHNFSLNLVHEATTSVVVPISGKFGVGSETDVAELTVLITQAVFPDEGNYTLTFNVDGFPVGSRVLTVERLKVSGG